jgi:hypothetical protein
VTCCASRAHTNGLSVHGPETHRREFCRTTTALPRVSVPTPTQRPLNVVIIALTAIFSHTLVGQESRSDLNGVGVVTVPNVSESADRASFARSMGLTLRDARRVRQMRRRHLADPSITASQLKAAERGELELSRPILTELSSRYGVDLGAFFGEREPLEIEATLVSIGDDSEPCVANSPSSALEAYLNLLDRVRSDNTGAPGEPRPLRRDDIQVLADHLAIPCTTVISEIAALMDAKRAETRAMVELYLAGASVVGLRCVCAS